MKAAQELIKIIKGHPNMMCFFYVIAFDNGQWKVAVSTSYDCEDTCAYKVWSKPVKGNTAYKALIVALKDEAMMLEKVYKDDANPDYQRLRCFISNRIIVESMKEKKKTVMLEEKLWIEFLNDASGFKIVVQDDEDGADITLDARFDELVKDFIKFNNLPETRLDNNGLENMIMFKSRLENALSLLNNAIASKA